MDQKLQSFSIFTFNDISGLSGNSQAFKRTKVAIQFYNGEFLPREAIKFSIDDVGILRGYGIFDFMRVIEGVPVFLENHLDRFENSAAVIGMELPFSREKIRSVIYELIKVNALPLGYIKLLMTGGVTPDGFAPGKPNLAVLNDVLENNAQKCYDEGTTLMTHDYTRDFPTSKTTGYVQAVKLLPQWRKDGHFDVLYHTAGTVTELSRSNIFFFKGDKLITNENVILKGISRMKVLEVAGGMFETEIRDFTLDELREADEVFMTSTNRRVMPVIKLDDQSIGKGKVGENCKKLLKAYDEFVMAYVCANKV
ncbi:MAG: aminotransferase IV [Roseivirga sp.]|nr:aminotransferase IV [Roseivirga sp.]